jgi:purine-binding chemotaxis protein CheW
VSERTESSIAGRHRLSLLCRVGDRDCAIPIEHVVETMRPLPIEPVPSVPRFVLGLATIRGIPTPVVDAASLLGLARETATRYVVLQVDGRRVALAVAAVPGVAAIPADSLHPLPPLLGDAPADVLAELAATDDALLFVLRTARIVPAAVHALDSSRGLRA